MCAIILILLTVLALIACLAYVFAYFRRKKKIDAGGLTNSVIIGNNIGTCALQALMQTLMSSTTQTLYMLETFETYDNSASQLQQVYETNDVSEYTKFIFNKWIILPFATLKKDILITDGDYVYFKKIFLYPVS